MEYKDRSGTQPAPGNWWETGGGDVVVPWGLLGGNTDSVAAGRWATTVAGDLAT